MPIASKNDLLSRRGPEALKEHLLLPGSDLAVTIQGLVRSYDRGAVYREIDELDSIRDVSVEGQRVPVTEDDIVAACWAAACVRAPKLTSLEWLMVGARDADLLALIGVRCLVCSRLMADEQSLDGVRAAEQELHENLDPLALTLSDSVSSGSEGFPPSSSGANEGPESGGTTSSTD